MKTLILRLLASVGLLVTLVTFTPFVSWYAKLLAGPWSNPDGKTLIVLGGARMEPEIIGNDTYWRAVYALRACRQGGFERVILSGAEVADSMGTFLRFQGVAAARIHLENKSLSTRENALFAKPLLQDAPAPLVLLTSDYHMFRAERVFARCGVSVRPRPIPDAIKRAGRWPDRWSVFLEETLETVKIVYYFTRGWI